MRVRGPVVVAMHVAFHVVAAGHDEDPALQADDVDLGSVEARQHRPGDHFVDGTERRLPPPEIKHAVERAEQRVQLVGAEQDGDPEFGLERLHQLHHLALVVRVEAEQRLVEQQQPRTADQRLGQQQTLPFAAGRLGQRSSRQLAGADQIEHAIDFGTSGLAREWHAQSVAIDDPGDEVPAAQAYGADGAANLRHVADRRVAPRRRPAEHADAAPAWRQQAKDGAHQCRLAGAVRSEHADELACCDLQADTVQHDAAAERQRHVAELDRVHGV